MRKRSSFGFDIILFASALALVVIGILFIFSSGMSSTGEIISNEYIKQIIWAVIGLILLFAVLATDYTFFRNISLYLYGFSILLLIFTLIFGRTVNGAKSWIGLGDFGIQPSEFTKITTILFLAWYYESREKEIKQFRTFIVGLGICAFPAILIIVQPDMGTALVYIPIFMIVSFIAGIKKRYLAYLLLLMIFLTLFTLLPIWESYVHQSNLGLIRILNESRYFWLFVSLIIFLLVVSVIGYFVLKKHYFYWLIYVFSSMTISLLASLARKLLKDYQIDRLIVFLDPSFDTQKSGWNIVQSITAIGSGGLVGKGYLQGTQSHYKFIPQQSTDFIFSIIGEEWGFIGSAIVMLLFMAILVRIIMITYSVKDSFSICLATGIFAMFSFHLFINIGMAIGIMPITGIPLLFLSYGGSSLLTALIGVGLILNIYLRRYKY